MGILTSVSIDEIRLRGSIKDSDVLKLRRALQEDCAIGADVAEALLQLDDACPIKDPAWAGFYVDALADYLVHQVKPEGYLVADNGRWLAARIGRNGRLRNHAELDLLLAVIEKARWSPPSLSALALDQVRHAVASGTGPLRSGLTIGAGGITPAEIEFVRRVLISFAGEAALAMTRLEADAVWDIDRAITGEKPTAWTHLFVKAIGHGVLASMGRSVPPRSQALQPDELASSGVRRFGPAGASDEAAPIGDIAARLVAGGAGCVWSTCRLQSPEERAMARLERQRLEIVTNEPIEEAGEAWLMQRLGEAKPLDPSVLALLGYLKSEAGTLPPMLGEMVARALIAA